MNLVVPITAEERPSRRVRTVAAMLDADESQIRRLLKTGELEAHTVGKRGVRIYLDSVTDYQARQARKAEPGRLERSEAGLRSRRPAPASTAAHRAALARLRAEGIL